MDSRFTQSGDREAVNEASTTPEGTSGASTKAPRPVVCDSESTKCFYRCVEEQGADYAADGFGWGTVTDRSRRPSGTWARHCAAARPNTLASRLSFYLGLSAKNGAAGDPPVSWTFLEA